MAFKRSVLVLANVTASSDELRAALTRLSEREPTSFRLVVPAASAGGLAEASATVERAVGRLAEAGLEVTGSAGHGDPIIAVSEVWDPRRYDEIVVSTLPMRFSKWLHAGLPERIARITGAPVTHVVSGPARPPVHVVAAAPHPKGGGLGPLAVLGWGGAHDAGSGRQAE